eukprot:372794_1
MMFHIIWKCNKQTINLPLSNQVPLQKPFKKANYAPKKVFSAQSLCFLVYTSNYKNPTDNEQRTLQLTRHKLLNGWVPIIIEDFVSLYLISNVVQLILQFVECPWPKYI